VTIENFIRNLEPLRESAVAPPDGPTSYSEMLSGALVTESKETPAQIGFGSEKWVTRRWFQAFSSTSCGRLSLSFKGRKDARLIAENYAQNLLSVGPSAFHSSVLSLLRPK